jgi:putative phosphoesterase
VDHGAWAQKIPQTSVLEVEGISIYVLHILEELDLKPEAAGFEVVIYGHSHMPKQRTENGVLYVNPGSAGPRRFDLPVTLGKLIVRGGRIQVEIIKLIE